MHPCEGGGRWHSTLHIISSICEQPRHTVALVVAVAFYALKKYSCSSIPRGPGYLCLPNSIYLSFALHRSQSSVFTYSKLKLFFILKTKLIIMMSIEQLISPFYIFVFQVSKSIVLLNHIINQM